MMVPRYGSHEQSPNIGYPSPVDEYGGYTDSLGQYNMLPTKILDANLGRTALGQVVNGVNTLTQVEKIQRGTAPNGKPIYGYRLIEDDLNEAGSKPTAASGALEISGQSHSYDTISERTPVPEDPVANLLKRQQDLGLEIDEGGYVPRVEPQTPPMPQRPKENGPDEDDDFENDSVLQAPPEKIEWDPNRAGTAFRRRRGNRYYE